MNNILLPSSRLNEYSNAFQIYPNPAHEVLNLNFQTQDEAAEVSIIDLDGKIILTKTITTNRATALSISNLAPAVYICHVKTKSYESSQKFVKE